jgi:hypothetical protein
LVSIVDNFSLLPDFFTQRIAFPKWNKAEPSPEVFNPTYGIVSLADYN